MNLFCSQQSRQAGLEIIGSALTHNRYIFIECPTPWLPYEFDSPSVPSCLKELELEIYDKYEQIKTRFFLIFNPNYKQNNLTKVLTFSKENDYSSGYIKEEFNLNNINQASDFIRDYLAGNSLNIKPIENNYRDILICTHGSQDKCCGKYGYPFYRQALKLVENLFLKEVRIWQVSHIGGHRFAPTAIDFPEGRYYGHLDESSFTSILTKTGDINNLSKVYRGWGILPEFVQVLEKKLMLSIGWDWFKYKVIGEVLEKNNNCQQVQLKVISSENEVKIYQTQIIADVSHSISVKGSCDLQANTIVSPFLVNS